MRRVIRSDVPITLDELLIIVEQYDCFIQAVPPASTHFELWAASEADAEQLFEDISGCIDSLGMGCVDYHECRHDEPVVVPCSIARSHGQWIGEGG